MVCGILAYQLPIVEKKPTATLSDAQGSGTVIGRYETNLGGSAGGRIENIRLSAASINGVVLAKGDSFSFNALIGDTTPDKGYQLGKEIVDGKFSRWLWWWRLSNIINAIQCSR